REPPKLHQRAVGEPRVSLDPLQLHGLGQALASSYVDQRQLGIVRVRIPSADHVRQPHRLPLVTRVVDHARVALSSSSKVTQRLRIPYAVPRLNAARDQ